MKLGYVGHGNLSYLDRLKGLAAGGKVWVDDTACSATRDAKRIQDKLRSMGAAGKNIEFRGVQVMSSGIWDKFLPGKHNITATVTTDKINFPACEEFEGKACGFFQAPQSAKCSKSGNLAAVQCAPGGLLGFKWKPSYALTGPIF